MRISDSERQSSGVSRSAPIVITCFTEKSDDVMMVVVTMVLESK